MLSLVIYTFFTSYSISLIHLFWSLHETASAGQARDKALFFVVLSLTTFFTDNFNCRPGERGFRRGRNRERCHKVVFL